MIPETPSADGSLCYEVLLDQMSEVLQTGDARELDDFLAAHPRHREQLEQMIPTLRSIATVTVDSASGSSFPAEMDLSYTAGSDKTLGDFRIKREIGRGGMGIVYEAEQLSMHRVVALKVLPFATLAGEKSLRRFENEVRAAALLDHPHIVSIYSVGEERGIHYYAMQLVRGQSLAEVIQHHRKMHSLNPTRPATLPSLPDEGLRTVDNAIGSTIGSRSGRHRFREIASMGIQAARALQYAHDQGVVHRDIKPGNLLLDGDGNVMVTDFGLANIESDVNLTATGELVGTLRYMSPEQALGQRAEQNHRADIYSLAATLYELLTFEPVLTGDDQQLLLKDLTRVERRDPRKLDPSIPADLSTILLKALEFDPADRYQSAAEFADDLQRYLQNQPIQARPPTALSYLAKWTRRNLPLVGLAGLGTSILCILLAASTLLISRAKIRTEEALAKAQRHSDQIGDLLYAADVQLAYQAWNEDRPDKAREILDKQQPVAEGRDRRGFEWHLLDTIASQPKSRTIGHHKGSANEIAVFPDGDRVASVGQDGFLCIWEANSGKLLRRIRVGEGELHAVAVSPCGELVATGSHFVSLWDVTTGKRVRLLSLFRTTVESIAFSPDGTKFAAASRYDRLRLFSRKGKLLKDIPDQARHITLAFTEDGNRLLVPSRKPLPESHGKSLTRVWSADLSKLDREIEFTQSWGTMARPFPDSEHYLISENTGFQNHSRIVRADTGETEHCIPCRGVPVSNTAISLDGSTFATGFEDGVIHCWNVTKDPDGTIQMIERADTFKAHDGAVKSLQFTGKKQLITCGFDGQVKRWRLSQIENPRRLGNRMHSLQRSPNDQFVAAVEDESTLLLMTPQGNVIKRIDLKDDGLVHEALSISPDSKRVAVSCRKLKALQVRDTSTGEVVSTFRTRSNVTGVAYNPTRNEIAIAMYSGGVVQILDATSFELIHEVSLENDADYRCMYSPDGEQLLCVGDSRGVTIINLRSNRGIERIFSTSRARCLQFDSTGTLLVTGHRDGTIRLWDFETRSLRKTLIGHKGRVSRLAISPDGRTLVSTGHDSTLRLWSLEDQCAYGVLEGPHRGWTMGVDFSKDGRRLYVTQTQKPGMSIFSLDERPGATAYRETN
ncbi:protein kinase domain-containing protein [Aeoliella sp.]|uniref:protein kinase domain-containing protein n=1 Tax=Aeoliella sp. TaxID=2795800 RepID=UPI003CCB96C8